MGTFGNTFGDTWSAIQQGGVLVTIPEGSLQFEGTTEYIFFEGETEYITFEN